MNPVYHKHILLNALRCATLCLLVLLPCAAAAEKANISQQDLQKVLQRLDTLTEQNKTLVERINALESKTSASAGGDFTELQEDVEELSELMNIVERKTLLDRIEISAEFRTRADWFEYNAHNTYLNIPGSLTIGGREMRVRDTSHYNEEVHALVNNRFRLNFKAQASNNLKLHARAVMYKNWWDDDSPSFPTEVWFNEGRIPSGNNLRIDRAYVDYFFTPHKKLPMALTFGRLPVIDSLPSDLRNETVRKSSWPAIFFDNIMDGAALTFMLSELTGLPDARFSLWYTRMTPDDDAQIYRKESLMEDWEVFMAHFETAIPKIDNSLLIISYVYVPEITPIDFRLAGSTPIDVPKDLGAFHRLTLYAQFQRFLNTNFDWFAGFTYFTTDSNGDAAKWRLGPFTHTYGLMSDDGKRDTAARAWHLGVRYTLPVSFLNNPKIGLEYNQGSKYYFGINAGAQDPLHKLDTRGAVWDLYYIQPLTKNLLIRLGYTSVEARYANGEIYIGKPRRIDARITNMYLLMDARF
ncbi:MAG: DUF3373 domain-containing protein [Deltaproteobacteria bacterium]|nr:DUF3373 domain-containing protein [Deltaproteobacteria bacterium]